jgi:hypothetical protein
MMYLSMTHTDPILTFPCEGKELSSESEEAFPLLVGEGKGEVRLMESPACETQHPTGRLLYLLMSVSISLLHFR